MQLPLNSKEKEEILGAYEMALQETEKCAKSINDLIALLESNFASISPELEKKLSSHMTAICSGSFKLKMRRYKLKISNLEGREFS